MRTQTLRIDVAVERTVARPADKQPVLHSETFDDARDGHAEAHAHRGDSITRVPALELVQQGRRHARPRGAERVAERDPAAVGVDVFEAVLEAGVPRELEDDRREGL